LIVNISREAGCLNQTGVFLIMNPSLELEGSLAPMLLQVLSKGFGVYNVRLWSTLDKLLPELQTAKRIRFAVAHPGLFLTFFI
jgi:hypothetical protein